MVPSCCQTFDFCFSKTSSINKSSAEIGLSPASSLIPLGLANALLGVYIYTHDEYVGASVYLRELCLLAGVLAILMRILAYFSKLILLICMRDSHVDATEARVVWIIRAIRYFLCSSQFVVFTIIFIHCVIIINNSSQAEWYCPRHVITICLITSGVILCGGVCALCIVAFLGIVTCFCKPSAIESSASNQQLTSGKNSRAVDK